MMRIEPKTTHPYLWVLRDVLGLSLQEIRRRSLVPIHTLREMDRQRAPTVDQAAKLEQLAQQVMDELAAGACPKTTSGAKKLPAPFRYWFTSPAIDEWRRQVYAVVRSSLDAWRPTPPQPRATELSVSLLAAIGTGSPRSRVMLNLQHRSNTSVERCAARIGVRRAVDPHTQAEIWLPPKNLPSVSPPPPAPQPAFARSRRASQVQSALELVFMRHPLGVPAADAVAAVRQRAGCNKTAVYRAARAMRVRRETSGFGAAKRTTWIYEPALQGYRDSEKP